MLLKLLVTSKNKMIGAQPMTTSELLEAAMLISFSLSWFWSISKMLATRTVAGKSIAFVISICLGYTLGILSKLIAWQQTEQLSPLFWFYIWNVLVIAFDALLVVHFAKCDIAKTNRNQRAELVVALESKPNS